MIVKFFSLPYLNHQIDDSELQHWLKTQNQIFQMQCIPVCIENQHRMIVVLHQNIQNYPMTYPYPMIQPNLKRKSCFSKNLNDGDLRFQANKALKYTKLLPIWDFWISLKNNLNIWKILKV